MVTWDDGTTTGTDIYLSTRTSLGPPSTAPAQPTSVSTTLQQAIDAYNAGATSDRTIQVLAVLRDHESMTGIWPGAVLMKGWIEGTITNKVDEDAAYIAALPAWTTALGNAQVAAYAGLTGHSYTVIGEGDPLPWVEFEVELSDIEAIAATDVWLALQAEEPEDIDVDGTHFVGIMGGSTVLDYSLSGYDGATLDGETAIYEYSQADNGHPGFETVSGASRLDYVICVTGFCSPRTSTPHPFGIHSHPTGVASAMMGSVMDGQDAAVITTEDRTKRSAVGRGLKPISYMSNLPRSLDDMLKRGVRVANFSGSMGGPNCKYGATASLIDKASQGSRGIAWFASGGNSRRTVGGVSVAVGDDNPTTREMSDSSMATGAIVVAAYKDDLDPVSKPRSGNGPSGAIIDITAPRIIDYGYTTTPSTNGFGYDFISGTSTATPIAAGAAGAWLDYFQDRRSYSLSTAPGILYANFLLMGDGYGVDGCTSGSACLQPDTGFDNTWGAGRLKVRTWDSGATSPDLSVHGSYFTGQACVSQSEVVSIPIKSPYVPLTIDDSGTLEVVARWTDSRPVLNNFGLQHDINIKVVRDSDGATMGTDTNPNNTKARTKIELSSGYYTETYTLQLRGNRVWSGPSVSCKDGSQRVHFAGRMEP